MTLFQYNGSTSDNKEFSYRFEFLYIEIKKSNFRCKDIYGNPYPYLGIYTK